MKNILLFVFVLITLAARTSNPENEELAGSARRAYDAGQYSACIQQYEKILKNGYESAVLYYNLGNAYYRTNDIPSSILNYEKALKLDPTNADIRFNLSFVNNKITDKVEYVPELFYKRWWKGFLNSVSIEFLSYGTILLLAVSLFLFSIYLISRTLMLRKAAFWTATGLFLLMMITFYAAGRKNYYLEHHHEAIVFTPTVTVKSSPDAVSKDLFVIHEGLKVELLDQIGDWQEIRIANGSVGWLKTSDVRFI